MSSMSGNFRAFKPQWRHREPFGKTINESIGLRSEREWSDVPFVTVRNGVAVRLHDGTELQVGVPFPSRLGGLLDTMGLCGHEQATALAWVFAAQLASVGGEVDVRVEEYELKYDLKAELASAPADTTVHKEKS